MENIHQHEPRIILTFKSCYSVWVSVSLEEEFDGDLFGLLSVFRRHWVEIAPR